MYKITVFGPETGLPSGSEETRTVEAAREKLIANGWQHDYYQGLYISPYGDGRYAVINRCDTLEEDDES